MQRKAQPSRLKKIRFTSRSRGIARSLSTGGRQSPLRSLAKKKKKRKRKEASENIAETKYLPAKNTLGCGGGVPGVAGGATGAAKRS